MPSDLTGGHYFSIYIDLVSTAFTIILMLLHFTKKQNKIIFHVAYFLLLIPLTFLFYCFVSRQAKSDNVITPPIRFESPQTYQTFSDPDLGVSFTYPSNWVRNSGDTWFLDREFNALSFAKSVDEVPTPIAFYFFYGPQTKSLDELAHSDGDLSDLGYRADIIKTTFDGEPGVIVMYYTADDKLTDIISYVNHGGMTYGFSSTGENEDLSKIEKDSDSILSTIRSLTFN
jgi:hypothetical protein